MANDFENIAGLENMSDGELRSLIRGRLDEQVAFDPADVDVEVNRGVVKVSGRVGTESERRVVDHLLTDVIGIAAIENDIFVDPSRRAESPEAIDDQLVDEAEPLSENVESELDGTTDVSEAISEGIPWNPPDSPTPEGLRGTDVPSDTGGEQH